MTEKVKQHAAPVTGSDEIDIGRLVGTVIEARWWVIGITAVFALCAVVYTFFATPIYSADALVQIEQNSGNSLVQDIGSALANKPPASDAEIQLIRSRLVLGKTVDDLDLDIAVSKNTFPIFGAGWDRLMGRQNETVKVISHQGNVFAIEPPITVELRVTETEPGVKGDTATGATKPAIVETGAQIMVPLFVNQDDVLKIDTRTGEYLSRV